MPYYPPQMPLRARVFRYNQLLTEPPAVETVCSLRYGWQGSSGSTGSITARGGNSKAMVSSAPTYLLFPRGTDLRRPFMTDEQQVKRDNVLVGATDGKLYEIGWWEDQWAGFPNEYRVAFVWVVNKPYWTTPAPSEYDLSNPIPAPAENWTVAQRRWNAGQ